MLEWRSPLGRALNPQQLLDLAVGSVIEVLRYVYREGTVFSSQVVPAKWMSCKQTDDMVSSANWYWHNNFICNLIDVSAVDLSAVFYL